MAKRQSKAKSAALMTGPVPMIKSRSARGQSGREKGSRKRATTARDIEGAPSPAAGPRETREWAALVFMKPDAVLEKAAVDDVEEMKEAGVLKEAYVAVQVERVNDVERFEIAGGQALLDKSPSRPASIAEVVEGFINWAVDGFPARKRLVVVWGHSTGVGFDLTPADDDSDAEALAMWAPGATAPGATVIFDPLSPIGGFDIRRLVAAIGWLKREVPWPAGATAAARAQGLITPDVVLGLDSCYMSGVECAYELRAYVDFLVSSESFMSTQGWNYRTVLENLARDPHLPARGLGEAIVEHVVTLPSDGSISMVALAKMDDLAADVRRLVSALRAIIINPTERRALKIVLSRVSYLQVRQFLDLRDMCHKLRQFFPGPVADAADAILRRSREEVVFHRAKGAALGTLNGLSIFYPYVRASTMRTFADQIAEANAVVDPLSYKNLAFVKDPAIDPKTGKEVGTGWGTLLDELFGD